MSDARAGDPQGAATNGGTQGGGGSREQAYQDAVRARDRLLARVTFWERRRAVLLLPLIALGGALGLLVGTAVRHALGWPAQTAAFGAVIGIVVIGRLVTSYFDVRQLEAAQRRVESLARQRKGDAR